VALETPVIFLIFNRPAATARSFEAIARARPHVLLVAADGPRTDQERELCAAARNAVLNRVDWPCDVRTRFLDRNAGPRYGPATGLDWAFTEVEKGIVLEDDCVAGPDFFAFCETLLDRFRDDDRVMEIGGSNYQFGRQRGSASYYFSRHAHTHGWATWRRAWRLFDAEVRDWPTLRAEGVVEAWCDDPAEQRYWTAIFQGVFEGVLSTWDYQWLLCRWANWGLAAVPNGNLVSNIGFGPDATHLKHRRDFSEMPIEPMAEVVHPAGTFVHQEADRYMFESHFAPPPLPGPVGAAREMAARALRWIGHPA
jgi:hypothetical protein